MGFAGAVQLWCRPIRLERMRCACVPCLSTADCRQLALLRHCLGTAPKAACWIVKTTICKCSTDCLNREIPRSHRAGELAVECEGRSNEAVWLCSRLLPDTSTATRL